MEILLLVQHLPVVLVHVDLVPVFQQEIAGVLLAVVPHIARRLEADSRNILGRLQQDPPLGTGADNGDIHRLRG